MVYHLHNIKSDHHPLAISFGKKLILKPSRPFQFLSAWLSHKDFVVNENQSTEEHLEGTVRCFVTTIKKWNTEVFGSTLKKK